MVNWMDPAEIARDAEIFSRFMHAITGVYAWEFIISMPFDWDVLTGKKRLRWPLAFYFLNRYLLLGAMCGILVALDSVSELNCQALYTFNQFVGNSAAGLASINLALRTMAVWQHNRLVDGGLIIIILGHWSLILQGVLLKAQWVPPQGCVITETNTTILSATFIYTMAFDAIVLVLNAYKLTDISFGKRAAPPLAQSRLAKLLFSDGLIYFLVAFLFNLLATIFMLMNLNPIMSIFFNVPAVVGSTIMALRAVRRLTNFATAPVEIYGSNQISQTGPTRFSPSGAVSRTKNSVGPLQSFQTVNGGKGVHVQMETFTKEEKASETDVAYLNQLRPDQYAIRELPQNRGLRRQDSDTESGAAF